MAIPLFEDDLAIISKLSDNPNTGDGLSAEELKAKFDAAPKLIQDYINNILIPNLDKTVDVDALVADLLDATLVIEGKAAEAKATGDAIAAVKETAEKALETAESIEPGASEEEIAQIQANADAIAALPISVREDGYTEISGLPQLGNVHTVQEGNVYTMTITLEDGSTSTNVITVENGLPSKIVVDGKEIPFTWEVVKAALTALDLFRGVDNTDVTGGWVFKLWGYGECDVAPTQTFTDDAMVITMSCTSAQYGAGSFATVNAIDLTDISKIKVKFDAIISGGATSQQFALCCDADTSAWPAYRVELAGVNGTTLDVTDREISLDVSSLSGNYYIGIQAYIQAAYADGASMTLTVKELVME